MDGKVGVDFGVPTCDAQTAPPNSFLARIKSYTEGKYFGLCIENYY